MKEGAHGPPEPPHLRAAFVSPRGHFAQSFLRGRGHWSGVTHTLALPPARPPGRFEWMAELLPSFWLKIGVEAGTGFSWS